MIKMKSENKNNLTIGLISGVISGLIVVVASNIAEVYNQKNNILLIISISLILLFIFVIRINWEKKKPGKRK